MRRRLPIKGLLLLGALALGAIATGCGGISSTPPPQVPNGSPQRGARDIVRFGCGACHVIPGIRGAVGKVGPPLTDFSERGYIAGELPNNGPNLIRWVMDPRDVEPGTDMPDLGVSQQQAQDIAAYLFALR